MAPDDDTTPADDDAADDDVSLDWWSQFEDDVYTSPEMNLPTGENTIEPPPGVTDLDPTSVTDFASSVEFLYTGDPPVQVGVDPDDIEPHRVAVLRGRVVGADGMGLPGVEVSVLRHGEFGHTLTRSDGGFDLAVNGGGPLTVRYHADGWIRVQRRIQAPWRDFKWLPDVVMTPYDSEVTSVELDAVAGLQVHYASTVSDTKGVRQASLLFAAGTEATAVYEDGTSEPLTTLNVRATEFTVGETGPEAMPADLPPTTAYTYAVELSVDEAVAAGAVSVEFSQPVVLHLDDFLGFPAGTSVPVGYYDYGAGAWFAAPSGLVIEVLYTDGASVELDVEGNGEVADEVTLDELGIDDEELAEIASSFNTGARLWRVEVDHFSPRDLNWGWQPEEGAEYPDGAPWWDDPLDEGMCETGSIIECHNQVLGESIGITGTPYDLSYRSSRMAGYLDGTRLDVQLGPGPASLNHIELRVEVAGRSFSYSNIPAHQEVYTFIDWSVGPTGPDGLGPREDCYERLVQGQTPVTVNIGYVFDLVYTDNITWAFPGGDAFETWNPADEEITLWQSWTTTLGILEAGAAGLGGWSISPHHAYDVVGQTTYFGDGIVAGRNRSALASVMTTVAGQGAMGSNDHLDGGELATEVILGCPGEVSVDAGGYPTLVQGSYLAHVDGDGLLVIDSGEAESPCIDGDPVADCSLGEIVGLTPGVDGWMWYGAQASPPLVWGIDDNGLFHVVADESSPVVVVDGHQHDPFDPDRQILDVAADTSGNVYFSLASYIYRIAPDGDVIRVAGTGELGVGDDGTPAQDSGGDFGKLAVSADGTLYAGAIHQYSQFGHRYRQLISVDAQGLLGYVTAGDGTECESVLDSEGAFVLDWAPCYIDALAAGPDGSVYLADDVARRLYRIGADHVVLPFAGGGSMPGDGGIVDGTPASDAWFNGIEDVAVGPDGTVFTALCHQHRIVSVRPPLPAEYGSEYAVPDGDALHFFDHEGRHTRTSHALTGAVLVEFSYDGDGLLTAITDGDGNVTSIERDGYGDPEAIVAPGGQHTTLDLDADGFLSYVANPAGEAFEFEYWPDRPGLLETFTPPKGGAYASSYTFEPVYARLETALDAGGGSKTLVRTGGPHGRDIVLETGLGRTRTYSADRLDSGAEVMTYVSATGAVATATTFPDGSAETHTADGVSVESTAALDPRWGMTAPDTGEIVLTTPINRRTAVITREREV